MNIETITNNFRQKMTVVNFRRKTCRALIKKIDIFFKGTYPRQSYGIILMRVLNQRHANATEIYVHAYWYSFNFESLSPKNWPNMGFN